MGQHRAASALIVAFFIAFFIVQHGDSLLVSLINNRSFNDMAKTILAQPPGLETVPQCAFPLLVPTPPRTSSFRLVERLGKLSAESTLEDQKPPHLMSLYQVFSEDTNVLRDTEGHYYTHMQVEDPLVWYMSRILMQDSHDNALFNILEEDALPSWWQWGSGFFLEQATCWTTHNRVDKAATNLAWHSQAVIKAMDLKPTDIDRGRSLYFDLIQMCELDLEGCDDLEVIVEPLMSEMYVAASQDTSERVRGEAHFSLATLKLSESGITGQVIEEYRQAVANDPSSVRYRAHFGSALTSLKQYERAEEQLSLALDAAVLPSERALVLGQIGSLDLSRERYAEAARDFAESLELDPESNSHRMGLAQAYAGLEHFSDSIRILRDVISREPEYALAWNNLGESFRNNNESENAIDAFTRATELDPMNVSFRLGLAQTLVEANRISEAIDQYSQILELEPSRTDVAQRLMELSE